MVKLFRWNGALVQATEEAYYALGRNGLLTCWREYEAVLQLHSVSAPESDFFFLVWAKGQAVWIFEDADSFTMSLNLTAHA